MLADKNYLKDIESFGRNKEDWKLRAEGRPEMKAWLALWFGDNDVEIERSSSWGTDYILLCWYIGLSMDHKKDGKTCFNTIQTQTDSHFWNHVTVRNILLLHLVLGLHCIKHGNIQWTESSNLLALMCEIIIMWKCTTVKNTNRLKLCS